MWAYMCRLPCTGSCHAGVATLPAHRPAAMVAPPARSRRHRSARKVLCANARFVFQANLGLASNKAEGRKSKPQQAMPLPCQTASRIAAARSHAAQHCGLAATSAATAAASPGSVSAGSGSRRRRAAPQQSTGSSLYRHDRVSASRRSCSREQVRRQRTELVAAAADSGGGSGGEAPSAEELQKSFRQAAA